MPPMMMTTMAAGKWKMEEPGLQRISMQVPSQTELTTENQGVWAPVWVPVWELGEKTCQRNRQTDGKGQ